jgi:uncharacterized protein (DUF342 family)
VFPNIVFVIGTQVEFTTDPCVVTESGGAGTILKDPIHSISIHLVDDIDSTLGIGSTDIINGRVLASEVVYTVCKINSGLGAHPWESLESVLEVE